MPFLITATDRGQKPQSDAKGGRNLKDYFETYGVRVKVLNEGWKAGRSERIGIKYHASPFDDADLK